MTDTVDWTKIKHMPRHEWIQDPDKVQPEVVYGTERLRVKADCPIHIHEAFAIKGHAKGSDHYLGWSLDMHFEPGCYSYQEQFIFIKVCPDIVRVGFYPDWNYPGFHLGYKEMEGKAKYWVRYGKSDYRFGEEHLLQALIPKKFWQVTCNSWEE